MPIGDDAKLRLAKRNDEIVQELRSAAGAVAPLDPTILVKRKAAELSAAMALIHGGNWRVQIDHQVGMVLVVRR